ncbi:cytochrome P450 4F5-like [Orbicella faveolata]|uniref:cytochrome P450 4F5-like n=1 Tax=Orbicella faveolata TaxID=48498 RepID=UPI0009E23CDA|nr:cytochrome P450 4F5-like [Orbicella faveolata]
MIIFILTIPILLWFMYTFLKDEFTSPLRKIPRPDGSVPVFGHLWTFLREKNHLKLVQDWSEKYGPIFRYSRGFGEKRVFLSGPDLIKHVAVTNSKNYARTEFVRTFIPSIGNGVFSSNGKEHARQRKMINPAFNYNNLTGMVDDFKEVTSNLVKLWTEQLTNSTEGFVEVLVSTDLARLTLDVIGRCAFGYHFNTVLSGETEISSAFSAVIKGVGFGRVMRKKLIPLYDYLPLAENKRAKKALEITDGTVLEVIKAKREKREEGIVSSKRDLLSLLMDQHDEETGATMDDELLRAQVFTFMLAGHETTSVSMMWTLYELARHPDIAKQVQQEIQSVMKDSSEMTWAKLAELKFLGNVIKESLRFHSPATMAVRTAKENDVIGGYEIPKGTSVVLGIDAVHHSTKFWKDPHAFDPQRFDENDDSHPPVHPYAFLPFSAGPRSCIGNKFAMVEMKAVLSILLQEFIFEEIPGFTVMPIIRLTAKPDPPLRLRIRQLTS